MDTKYLKLCETFLNNRPGFSSSVLVSMLVPLASMKTTLWSTGEMQSLLCRSSAIFVTSKHLLFRYYFRNRARVIRNFNNTTSFVNARSVLYSFAGVIAIWKKKRKKKKKTKRSQKCVINVRKDYEERNCRRKRDLFCIILSKKQSSEKQFWKKREKQFC